MKQFFIIPILVALVVLGCQCSSNNNSLPSSNVNSSNSTPAESQTPVDTKERERRKREWDESTNKGISEISKQVRIANLKDIKLDDSEKELRIWRAGGILVPQCFILKTKGEKRNAIFVTMTFTKVKKKEILVNTPLGAPKSGWEEIDRYLKEEGIDSTIKLSTDYEHVWDPDETAIVIEIKSGAGYSNIEVPFHSETPDSEKAKNVWRRIRQEFDLDKIVMRN